MYRGSLYIRFAFGVLPLTEGIRRKEDRTMWDRFPKYEKLLWSIVWKWMYKVGNKYEPNDLFNELVIVYINSYRTWTTDREMVDWRGKSELEFKRLLWRSCYNQLYDVVIRRHSRIMFSIDDVVVTSTNKEFNELMNRFMLEEIWSLLRTEEGRDIFDLVVKHPEKLARARRKRREIIVRNRLYNKQDLGYYFKEMEGWECLKYRRGIQDVERALNSVWSQN